MKHHSFLSGNWLVFTSLFCPANVGRCDSFVFYQDLCHLSCLFCDRTTKQHKRNLLHAIYCFVTHSLQKEEKQNPKFFFGRTEHDVPVAPDSSIPLPSFAPSASACLPTTTTASIRLRVWRRAAVASVWVRPRRLCPFIDNTSSPFCMVPSWAASPLENTLWTWIQKRKFSDTVCTIKGSSCSMIFNFLATASVPAKFHRLNYNWANIQRWLHWDANDFLPFMEMIICFIEAES